MIETRTLQGRRIGPLELAQVRALLVEHPDWSRYRLSRQWATLWDWRNPVGQLKDLAARTLPLKLEQRGWITLSACRCASPNRLRHKPRPPLEVPVPAVPIPGTLTEWLPLTLRELSQETHRAQRALFDALLPRRPCLSHRSTAGENLQCLGQDRSGRPLACVWFGAAAGQCRARDQHIGWDAATRQRRLSHLTNNTRFLILPWVRVSHLASHPLGRITRRLSEDGRRKYGHPIHLLETFVDSSRFPGPCYRAANWQAVGQPPGRTRQNKTRVAQAPPKAAWLHPLRPDYRQAPGAS